MRLGGKVEIDEDDLAHCYCAQCGCAGAGPVVTRVCGKLQSREQSQREGKAAQQRRLTAHLLASLGGPQGVNRVRPVQVPSITTASHSNRHTPRQPPTERQIWPPATKTLI